jgi:maltokinase
VPGRQRSTCKRVVNETPCDPRTHGTLLGALELQKAIYEAIYEIRNRPAWIDIPLNALRRLLAASMLVRS